MKGHDFMKYYKANFNILFCVNNKKWYCRSSNNTWEYCVDPRTRGFDLNEVSPDEIFLELI